MKKGICGDFSWSSWLYEAAVRQANRPPLCLMGGRIAAYVNEPVRTTPSPLLRTSLRNFKRIRTVPSHRSNISHEDLSKCSDAIQRPTSPLILNNSHWIPSGANVDGSYGTNSRRRDVRLQERLPLSFSPISDPAFVNHRDNIRFFLSYAIYNFAEIF